MLLKDREIIYGCNAASVALDLSVGVSNPLKHDMTSIL